MGGGNSSSEEVSRGQVIGVTGGEIEKVGNPRTFPENLIRVGGNEARQRGGRDGGM